MLEKIQAEIDTVLGNRYDVIITNTYVIIIICFSLSSLPFPSDPISSLLLSHHISSHHIFSSALSSVREMTVDDLPKLKYMTMALKETLRMYPAAVILSRAVPKGFRLGDHELPDFATLWIAVWSFHRDEKMWPNPNRFDPEKFADEKQLPHVVSCNEQTEKTKQDEEEEPIIRRRRRRSTKEYKEEEEEMKKAEEEKKRRKVTFFFFFFLFFYVGMPFSLGPRNCIGNFKFLFTPFHCFSYHLHLPKGAISFGSKQR